MQGRRESWYGSEHCHKTRQESTKVRPEALHHTAPCPQQRLVPILPVSVILPKTMTADTMGKSFWVSRAVRAAYLLKPPMPRHNSFWDVTLVFDTIIPWGSNSQMTLARLSKKLLVLLLQVSGQRGQAAMALDLWH